ncbi:hypothetical protein F5146DRAFT_1035779 [Armillaria mellea]|nr:hypothetical protein F5146DRAFT_1035779 [Armillaria mellea]
MIGFARAGAYIGHLMGDGHSFVYDLLGQDLIPSLLRATKHQQCFKDSKEAHIKARAAETENLITCLLQSISSYFAYASILKRSHSAISHAERIIEFPESHQDMNKVERLLVEWVKFRNAAFAKNNLLTGTEYRVCGYEQCPNMPGLLDGTVTTTVRFKSCSGCQFVLYCSRECQKAHWNTGHRTTCEKIKNMRQDGKALPMSTSDKNAMKIFNNAYLNSLKGRFHELTNRYISKNGEDGEWPLVLLLDYDTPESNPYIAVNSSESIAETEGFRDHLMLGASSGLGTLVYWSAPNGRNGDISEVELMEY